ncbi:MAG: prenyltransferase/squalene oxidase repeat-containing protein, partial [Promethearchaeota archaeon]
MFSVIPAVLGKERKSYLISFIYSTEIDGKGFSNSKIDDVNVSFVSFEATAYALQILDSYGRNPHDKSLLTENLKENITEMFNEDNVDLYNLYFLLKSIEILDSIEDSIDITLKSRISEYLNQTEQDGGFSISNVSSSVSLSYTYYAIQIFSLINETVNIHKNITLHKNWILSCGNLDGGYGGNSSLTSTILNTYYAVSLLSMLGTIDDLIDKNQTLAYLKSFYISDSGDLTNYGGYLPFYLAKYAMLYSTFYCVSAINLIDDEELNKSPTVNWVIDHQNYIDGGFVDSTDG